MDLVAVWRGNQYGSAMSSVRDPVGPGEDVAHRLTALGVRAADLVETFVHSGGHGGQNVNKVATCVQLVHVPTGLQVKCQTTRRQGLNRRIALELLLEKLEARQQARRAAERSRMEKARRARRGRTRGGQERVLADKSKRSVRKAHRRPPTPE